MEPALSPLLEQLNLNTRLFLNCLDDVDDATAARRPSAASNSLGFIACHLLDARCFLARYLALDVENPYQDLFDSVSGIDELDELPAIDGVRATWRHVSAALAQRLPTLTRAELTRESKERFPVDDPSVLGGIAFLLGHESFHIGQLAFLRKHYGLGPMTY